MQCITSTVDWLWQEPHYYSLYMDISNNAGKRKAYMETRLYSEVEYFFPFLFSLE